MLIQPSMLLTFLAARRYHSPCSALYQHLLCLSSRVATQLGRPQPGSVQEVTLFHVQDLAFALAKVYEVPVQFLAGILQSPQVSVTNKQ